MTARSRSRAETPPASSRGRSSPRVGAGPPQSCDSDPTTRRCGFCAVQKGAPLAVDYDEPRRVAEACATLGLKYAVITSVNRDDRKDGGAELFALTIEAIRQQIAGCKIEVLVPDFQGSHAAMDVVMNALSSRRHRICPAQAV